MTLTNNIKTLKKVLITQLIHKKPHNGRAALIHGYVTGQI